jgi:hypothetical protein
MDNICIILARTRLPTSEGHPMEVGRLWMATASSVILECGNRFDVDKRCFDDPGDDCLHCILG